MGEYTKYPNQIDTTNELPKATDLVTPVKAEVVNRLRDAVLALENELGTDPSGVFSTVKSRIDSIDSDFANLADEIEELSDRVEDLELNGGGGGGNVIASKVKVYIDSSNFAGAAVNIPQTISWNATSSFVNSIRNSVEPTTISPDISGHFLISGQLTVSPTIDSISSILVEVLNNGVVNYSFKDSGAVWGVGLERSFSFSFPSDLEGGDLLSVRLTHSGSASSAVEVVLGESKSWFAMTRICGVE